MSIKHSIAGITYRDGRVLTARRVEVGQMGGRWEFPGGKVEQDETYEQTVIREYLEEFSAQAVPGRLIAQAKFHHNGDIVKLHAFEVDITTDESLWKLTEHTAFEWITFDEIQTRSFVDSDLLLLPQIRAYYSAAK